MISVDLSNVKASGNGDFKRLCPTGYVCRIKKVENIDAKEYLKIYFDISEGDEAGYAAETEQSFGNWPRSCILIRSYKQTALGMFKGFVESVEKSNDGYQWTGDENTLAGKLFGVVLREEAYIGQDRDTGMETEKTRLSVDYTTSIDKIREGAFKVRDKKPLSDADIQRLTPFSDFPTAPSPYSNAGYTEVTD